MTSGGKKDSTYIDDVFSTYLWAGNDESGRSISNGIKLSNNNIGNSVYLNGTNEYLSIPSSSDFAFGTGDFTWEGWFYINDDGSYLISFGADVGNIDYYTYGGATRRLRYYNNSTMHQEDASTVLSLSTWYHIAAARSSNTTKVFLNGTEKLSFTDSKDYGAEALYLGATSAGGSRLTGNISNVRIVKGQALYTSSFTPSTQALTTTSQGATASNVKLLCCNKSTPTGATVTPGTITTHGTPESQGFGPFTGNDGEGGLVWIKSRTTGHVNCLFDTERGANQRLRSDSNLPQNNNDTLQPLFTNSGFTVGGGNEVNGAGNNYASWTWRKQKGFFDVVTWTGTGSARTIPHNLGSVPGCIMVKKTSSGNASWAVYHRSLTDANRLLMLNTVSEELNNANFWNGTDPTSTHFSLGTDPDINGNGSTFVAYLFAGGESTADTARSVDFDGSGDYLSIPDSSDFEIDGTNFTFECWFKADDLSGNQAIAGQWELAGGTDRNFDFYLVGSTLYFENCRGSTNYSVTTTVAANRWYHIAGVLDGTTLKLFVNGNLVGTTTVSGSANNSTANFGIGGYATGNAEEFNGKISNLRFVKGTAVYTGSFRPPTEPLTAITNTKLLCCNSSSVTGSTVTPGTITNNSATASTDSPFDDPEGFKFGEGGDQNIIKCGSYIGNGSSNGPDINLGWEPQWFIVKNATSNNTNWLLFDSMRGLTDSDQHWEANLKPNSNDAEWDNDYLSPTSRGFRLTNGGSTWVNENNSKFIYIAIRMSDGLVGKPPEAGTDALAMDRADGSSTPCFISDFPVDFSYYRTTAASGEWYVGNRLKGTQYINTFGSSQVATSNNFIWDYSNGWRASGLDSNWMAWMWKRGAGLDVVCYDGMSTARTLNHSLGGVPEMIWVRNLNWNVGWYVYHKGLNGGSNPINYGISLSGAGAQYSYSQLTDLTDSTFGYLNGASSGTSYIDTNNTQNNASYLAVLFRSVAGISKCGYYTGSSSELTITTGFQPRFVIIKNITNTGNNWTTGWFTFDTTRGWAAGNNDYYMRLNDTGMQDAGSQRDWTNPISTGFTINANSGNHLNNNTENYIYYAHA